MVILQVMKISGYPIPLSHAEGVAQTEIEFCSNLSGWRKDMQVRFKKLASYADLVIIPEKQHAACC